MDVEEEEKEVANEYNYLISLAFLLDYGGRGSIHIDSSYII